MLPRADNAFVVCCTSLHRGGNKQGKTLITASQLGGEERLRENITLVMSFNLVSQFI